MHFDYAEDHEMLRDAARGYLERHIPIVRLRSPQGLDAGFRRAGLKADAAQGWAAMLAPEGTGGLGVTAVEFMVVAEELGHSAHAGAFIPANAVAWALGEAGSPSQKALIPVLASGEASIAWAAFGPGGEWNAASGGVPAEATNVGFKLTGEARLVQDADIADFILIAARTSKGLSQLLVPTTAPGLTVTPEKTIDISRAHFTVRLDGVQVTADALLGPEGQAASSIDHQVRIASMLTSADSVGAAARLLAMTVAYAKERPAFGKPIAGFQAVKHRCADMLIQVESARVAVWYAAVALRDGRPDADEAASIAKFYATEAASWVAGQALQLHGGIGFTWEHDLHVYLKRAKANETLWGSAAWHRDRVAKGLAL